MQASIPLPDGSSLSIAVEGSAPPWLPTVITRLAELLRLPANWDTYGAPPVSTAAVGAAVELLLRISDRFTPPPQLVPTAEGLVQLEWHEQGIDLEALPRPDGLTTVFFSDQRTGDEWEHDLETDLTRLRASIHELTCRE